MSKDRNTDAERPLGPRSLIASLLLRSQPPRMRPARLVQWCRLFGVSEGAARVALSRMVDRGELLATDGMYELAGRVGGRRPAQDWSIEPRLPPWNGTWRIAAVTSTNRAAAERSALRNAMRQLRLGEVREGVWTRPDNLPRASAPAAAWGVADAQCEWWTGQPDDDPAALATRLFDPVSWSAGADRRRSRLVRVTADLVGASDRRLARAFLEGAGTLAYIRADPFLPVELGPSRAAGDALRAAYRAYEAAFSDALRAWFRAHA